MSKGVLFTLTQTSSEVSPGNTRQLITSISDGWSLFSLKSLSGNSGSRVNSGGNKIITIPK